MKNIEKLAEFGKNMLDEKLTRNINEIAEILYSQDTQNKNSKTISEQIGSILWTSTLFERRNLIDFGFKNEVKQYDKTIRDLTSGIDKFVFTPLGRKKWVRSYNGMLNYHARIKDEKWAIRMTKLDEYGERIISGRVILTFANLKINTDVLSMFKSSNLDEIHKVAVKSLDEYFLVQRKDLIEFGFDEIAIEYDNKIEKLMENVDDKTLKYYEAIKQ